MSGDQRLISPNKVLSLFGPHFWLKTATYFRFWCQVPVISPLLFLGDIRLSALLAGPGQIIPDIRACSGGEGRFIISARSLLRGNPLHRSRAAVSFLRVNRDSRPSGLRRTASPSGGGTFLSALAGTVGRPPAPGLQSSERTLIMIAGVPGSGLRVPGPQAARRPPRPRGLG